MTLRWGSLESERGGARLTAEDRACHRPRIALGASPANDDVAAYLEVEVGEGNHPSCYVNVHVSTPEDLIARIRSEFAGWTIGGWNLSDEAPRDGEGCVLEADEAGFAAVDDRA